jgi:phage tail sheath protein FI
MAVAPTYPGVYIEEIPSGVHTITGVATSITAFVGFTQTGPVNKAVHLYSFADFERAFGGVTDDSLVSRAVKDFFQNGGTEAFVVRVAQNPFAASVDMKRTTAAAAPTVLSFVAFSEGTWGNNLRIDVDYDTVNPDSFFNVTVTQLVNQNGSLVVGRTEKFRNLSMDSAHPSYAVSVINGTSNLVRVSRPLGLAYTGNGTSTSATLTLADFATALPAGYRLAYTLNGQGPFEITVATPTPPAGATLLDALTSVITDVTLQMAQASPPGVAISAVAGNTQLQFKANTDAAHLAEQSSIHFVSASRDDAAKQLKLGLANGGTEADASAMNRPLPNGTGGGSLTMPPTSPGALTIEVRRGGTSLKTGIAVNLWGAPTTVPQPTSPDVAAAAVNAALVAAAATEPLLSGARAYRTGAQSTGGQIWVVGPGTDPNLSYVITGSAASDLGLTGGGSGTNVFEYALGAGISSGAQVAGIGGNNGTTPTPQQITGALSTKTGIYALEDVDLFNLLVIPEASNGTGLTGVLTEAIAYCSKRRAFMIIDAPSDVGDFAAAQVWSGSASSPLRSRNCALYFPRMRAPDPLANGIVKTCPAAGALAGLYARTDAERGVWKAPAGTTANLSGATGVSYLLTDGENGALNPLGINCIRSFPVYGTVAWGARTGNGADAMADDYKYIPVRRLALFLEESLFRGSQWVVFEPNDEPLWAQIRLNFGAFMHSLFAQGAFQGQTPRDAYFVKCDKETTTQNDIDLGRVNIVVGFAPLKPAEFVIIKIQQIVRDLQV